jgi:hypothetical protein
MHCVLGMPYQRFASMPTDENDMDYPMHLYKLPKLTFRSTLFGQEV